MLEQSGLADHGIGAADMQPVIEGAYRGVIYGSLPPGAKRDVEIFANGLSLGIASVVSTEPNLRQPFYLKVPVDLILAAPVTLGGRFADEEGEGHVFELAEEAAVLEALTLATGRAAISGGMISGAIERINPDALPLTISVTTRGQIICKKVLPRTTGKIVGLAGARSGSIAEMRFAIPLPIDLLDTAGARISVRLEGAQSEFEGCPILITVSNGDSILQRLSAVEARVEQLMEDLGGLHDKLVASLLKQYADVIIPRVDAAVMLQRTALERQMMALSHALPGHAFTPTPRELPKDALFVAGSPYVGYGWSASIMGPRFLSPGKQAFTAFEISADHDALVVIEGAGNNSIEMLRSVTVVAGSGAVDLTIHVEAESGIWWATGIIAQDQIGSQGLLTVKVQAPSLRSGEHPIAIRQISILSMGWGYDRTGGAEKFRLLAGFYDDDKMPDGTVFNWMSGNGLMAVPCNSASRRLIVSGPMVLSEQQGRTLRLMDEQGEIFPLNLELVHGGWQAELPFTPHDRDFALIRLMCDARQPDNGDTRALSVALSDVKCLN